MPRLAGRLQAVALPLRTERLTLRLARPVDASALARAGNDPRVSRGTFVAFPFHRPQALEYIRRGVRRAQLGEGLTLLLEESSSGRILGIVGFAGRPRDPVVEIFYWLTPSAWGKGLASEAVGAILALAFGPLKLHRVSAHVIAFNRRSMRVLAGFGFTQEGRMREVRQEGRGWQDELIFGLLETEYRRGRSRPRDRPSSSASVSTKAGGLARHRPGRGPGGKTRARRGTSRR